MYRITCACYYDSNSPRYSWVLDYHYICLLYKIKHPLAVLWFLCLIWCWFLNGLLIHIFGVWSSHFTGNWLQQVTMALAFNNNHIIYYHMDAQFSRRSAWTYFTGPDYSAAPDWIHATFYILTLLIWQSPLYTIILSCIRVWWITHLWAFLVQGSWL